MVRDADTLPAQSMTGGSTTSTGAAGFGRATGTRGGGASTRSSICEKASSAGLVGAALLFLISNLTLPLNETGASSAFTTTSSSTAISTSWV